MTGSSTVKRVIFPSPYVGSRRFMDQLYYDGMVICSKVGFPDLLITFTCNPNWPEIQRVLVPLNFKPQDRPDIIDRIFKMKFDRVLADVAKKDMYTIEFQKRGLPHAHILIFLHPSNKYPGSKDIDKIISAEVPDPVKQPRLYNLVKNHMVHGPCGLANQKCPCMKDGKCSKYYPKKFQDVTIVDQDGYPVYRRRDQGNTVDKNGVAFHSGHVVPHNPSLLMKYEAHINMEWCNQSTSIKYLFKYINKGSDRISAVIVPNNSHTDGNIDEIKITLIVDMYHQVKHAGKSSLMQFMVENQQLKGCFFTWREKIVYTTKIVSKMEMYFLNQVSQNQCLHLGLWQIVSMKQQGN
ncbi:hypothetical protein KIW84_043566 [Lathyrus oleraceus]|uniref:Helitron helicase-like domain-containing protein n=1 Tax=Pisum sativum TaxID=3888 RepID=A0A9D5AU73_PEA|nr:hypothetical protein KIW84_043566 [Pisum sativum]